MQLSIRIIISINVNKQLKQRG